MTRSRRRTFGLTVSAAVHLVAFAVLTPVVLPRVRTRLPSPDTPPLQVQLIRLRDGLGRSTPPAPDQPAPLTPSTPGTPQPPLPPEIAEAPQDDPTPLGVIVQNAPLDVDPLFRVPFRNAAGQAEAALRGGLDCAHVDLQQLPRALVDRCAAASRHPGTTDGSKLLS